MKAKFLFYQGSNELVPVPYEDASAVHNVKFRKNPDGPGHLVFIDPPIPGIGEARKTFRSTRKAVEYAADLLRKPCLICEMGGSHARP